MIEIIAMDEDDDVVSLAEGRETNRRQAAIIASQARLIDLLDAIIAKDDELIATQKAMIARLSKGGAA